MYKFLGWLFLFNWTVFHSQIEGDWYGTLDAMGQKLPLVLHLKDTKPRQPLHLHAIESFVFLSTVLMLKQIGLIL